jgi:glycine/D-amino acid oxidase-like deaminating enzyme
MVGSSAAKYAALAYKEDKTRVTTTPAVCLLGPEEPKYRQAGQTIFAAYYDEARITRSTDFDSVWAILARRSIARYRDIERDSGINFYHEVGCLSAGITPSEDDVFISNTHQSAMQQQIPVEQLNHKKLCTRFPYVGFSPQHVGLWESRDAGYINPRLLVQAQQRLAVSHGCEVIRDVVCSVQQVTGNNSKQVEEKSHQDSSKNDQLFKVETDTGRILYAKKVLLATNAFTEGFRELLPPDIHLDMDRVSQAVIFAELSLEDTEKLKNMPSMVLRKLDNRFESERNPFSCYVVPPVIYPDGKTYAKLGHGSEFEKNLSPEETIHWYMDPTPTDVSAGLEVMFCSAFPDLHPLSMRTETCVTVHTVTQRPYIDFVTLPAYVTSRSLGVAVGCCGKAAKSSDELGRLAAQLMLSGKWPDEQLRMEDFELKTLIC